MATASPDVIERIVRVGAAQAELEEKRRETAEAEKTACAEEEGLMEAIAAGGTTGDWLRDQVIRTCGYGSCMEAAYHQVNDQLMCRRGEFALLAYDHEKYVPPGILFGGAKRVPASFYRLGVLEEDELVLAPPKRKGYENGMLDLPVTRFVAGEKGSYLAFRKPQVVEARLFDQLGEHSPPHFTMYIMEKSGLYPATAISALAARGPTNVELVVGNAAVRDWLENAGMMSLYDPAARVLGMFEL